MAKNKGINSGSEYTVSYGNFRGVDRNSDSSEVSSVRLSYSENMYRDYDGENAGAVESISGAPLPCTRYSKTKNYYSIHRRTA